MVVCSIKEALVSAVTYVISRLVLAALGSLNVTNLLTSVALVSNRLDLRSQLLVELA